MTRALNIPSPPEFNHNHSVVSLVEPGDTTGVLFDWVLKAI